MTATERRKKLQLVTRQELAEMTGLSLRTIRDGGAGTRQLPIVRLGEEVRYRLEDVEAWMRDNTHQPIDLSSPQRPGSTEAGRLK